MKIYQNRLLKLTTVIALVCVLLAICSPALALAADERASSPILLLDAGEVVDNRVEIVATLAKNSGITGMTLTLSYDSSAMTLVSATDGQALSSLSPIHSGKLSTMPYKINYMGPYYENDYTKGVLLTFVFEINSDAKDGTYQITLTGERNGVEYLDEEGVTRYKSIVSDAATITVKGEQKVVEITPGDDPNPPDDPNTKNNDWLLLVIIISVIAILLVVLTVILVMRKGNKR